MLNLSHMINFVVTLILLAKNIYAVNIFCVFPTPSYSHQQPMLALTHALAEKGHNLTVVTTNPSKFPIKNHREIDISYLYEIIKRLQSKTSTFSAQTRRSPYSLVRNYPEKISYLSTLFFELPQVKNLIREMKEGTTKYDLMIYESLFHPSLMGFYELLDHPPLIGLVTVASTVLPNDVEMGNPFSPSYNPNILFGYDDRMSFWERFNNFALMLYSLYVMEFNNKGKEEEKMRKYFGNLKYTANEMEYNKSLLIVSADLSTSYPRPVNPNTIFVGPMHIKNPEPLPQDIKKWMDEAEDGVVYFSLGTNVRSSSLPEEKRLAFIRAFSNFPKIHVLWKWDDDHKFEGPDNILVKQWLPQQSILAHPKTKLFISQVGLQSFQEAVHFAVPVLAVPVFADQDYNAKKVESAGVGLTLDFNDIDGENLYETLKELLTNTSYKERMQLLSAISTDKPMSPIDTAVWWIEYVLRNNGAPHLRPAVLDLYWYQKYMFDVYLFVTGILLFGLFATYHMLRKLCTFSKNKIKSKTL